MLKSNTDPTAPESRALTLGEFQDLPDDGYHHDELVRGRLVREPPPNDEHGWLTAVREKIRDYLDAGAKMVWIVDPVARAVTVHRPRGEAQVLRVSDQLDGEDVLPGFRLPLARLFAY